MGCFLYNLDFYLYLLNDKLDQISILVPSAKLMLVLFYPPKACVYILEHPSWTLMSLLLSDYFFLPKYLFYIYFFSIIFVLQNSLLFLDYLEDFWE